jgi:U3 small nucleolar RNA-associated protein 13
MLKHHDDGLSRTWVVAKRQGAFFTGGSMALACGNLLACLCNERVALLDAASGVVRRVLPAPAPGVADEPIVCFTVTPDGSTLLTFGRGLLCTAWALPGGAVVRQWRAHKHPVQVAACDASGALVATGGSDRVVMVWDVGGGFATHAFRGGHEGLVSALAFQPGRGGAPTARLLSGGADGRVCVWDLHTQACVAVLVEHTSAVTALLFAPAAGGAGEPAPLVTAGRDRMLHVWDLARAARGGGGGGVGAGGGATSGAIATGAAAHLAAVPIFEGVEGAVVLPAEVGAALPGGSGGGVGGGGCVFATAGDRGTLRAWRLALAGGGSGSKGAGAGRPSIVCVAATTAEALQARAPPRVAGGGGVVGGADALPPPDAVLPLSRQFAHLLLTRAPPGAPPGWQLVAVTRDQTLALVPVPAFSLRRSLCGFNDAFTDAKFIPTPQGAPLLLAASTNSEQLRIVDVATFDTRLCDGHTGVVLAVAPSPDGALVATASKDGTARVWDVATGACVAVCEGHTESVTALCFPSRAAAFLSAGTPAGARAGAASWLATASRDRTLKLWALAPLLGALPFPRPEGWDGAACAAAARAAGASPFAPRALAAAVAHEKDVNAAAVAPNDRVLATASQDKTVRLWVLPSLAPLATLRGHKRGVWAVSFSPAEQVLASASGDGTVRVWGASPASGYACLRAFEGHDGPVLCLAFLRRGLQLVSGGGDGLLKLWNVRDAECVGTFDGHGDKVWCVAAAGGGGGGGEGGGSGAGSEVVVTGGGDSVLNVWRDATAGEVAKEVAAAEGALRKQAALSAAMSGRDYRAALRLTLELDQPARCGDVLAELLEGGPSPRVAGVPPEVLNERHRLAMLEELAALRALGGGGEEGGGAAKGAVASTAAAAPPRAAPAPAAGGSGALLPEGLHPEGVALLRALLGSLRGAHLARLLSYVREWNTRAKHALLAQRVLHLLLRAAPRSRLQAAFALARAEAARAAARVLPGVGVMSVPLSEDALSGEAGLAPLATLVGAAASDDAAAGGGGGARHATAAAELRAFVDAALPYTRRHYERLERLLQSVHLCDHVMLSGAGLPPLAGAEGLGRLMGGELPPPRRAAAAARAALDEDLDDSGASSGEEGGGGGGGGANWASLFSKK